MRRVSMSCQYPSGAKATGTMWRVFDEDAKKDMPEVQSFTMSVSIDDTANVGEIVWIDFSSIDDSLMDDLREVKETVEIVSIIMGEV